MSTSWVIGSSESCDIRLESPYVSGKHCRLERVDGGWVLEDLGSTNGTFINGARLRGRTTVTRSDRITLGQTTPLPWPGEPEPADAISRHHVAEPHPLRLPETGGRVTIGRASDCDIVLNVPMVSSHHAAITHTPEGWFVRDLGSTNGTFVRHLRITAETEVHPGDVIGLGSHRLRLARDTGALEEVDRRGQASVEVRSVAVDVDGGRIVSDVSLAALPGELIGVMGASGAGKSTLLASIVGDQPVAEGRVVIAGIDVHGQREQLRGQVGYVPQDDIMHTELKVEQALWYSARLRLPRDYSSDEIRSRVTAVISALGLAGVAATRIGSATTRGISGGQRKRVNVALEMITDPPVLVLDEPTSGLSSVDALTLVQQLRKLADSGKTVLLTIHQPSREILRLLSAVAVLARDDSTEGTGRLVWYGPAFPAAAAFFEPDQGPTADAQDADAILRGLSRRPAAAWVKDYKNTPVCRAWITERLSKDGTPVGQPSLGGYGLRESARQCGVLMQRMLAVKAADHWNTALLVLQAPVIAVLVAGVFGAKAGGELSAGAWGSVANAVAMSTFLLGLAAVWFGCSNAARELVDERAIYRRERNVGLSPAAYLASKVLVLGMICAAQCVILSVAGVWGCGLEGNWLYGMAAMVLAAGVGTMIGLFVSAMANSPATATALLPVVVLPLVVLGGVLVPMPDLSYAFGLLADLMPSRWVFEALLGNEAAARALLQYPDPSKPWVPRFQDIAEPWFPRSGWRSGGMRPLFMLGALWLFGVGAVYSRLARRRL